MQTSFIQTQGGRRGNLRVAGGSLIEVMFASAILILVVLALLSAHLMGLRQNQLVESKSGASDTTRKILNQLPHDIKSSKMWFLGNMSGTNFQTISNSAEGTALKLFTTTNGSQHIVYYFDLAAAASENGKLMRWASGSPEPVIMASNLVNWLGGGYTFRTEDFQGQSATNDGTGRSYKQVIHTTLQFSFFQYPRTPVGTNGLYDYYKMEFKATPHLPE